MRYKIAAVGQMRSGPLRDLSQEYLKRLTAKVDILEFDAAQDGSPFQRKVKEAKALKSALSGCTVYIALDERGKSLTSPQFADLLQDHMNQGHSTIGFCLGGPDGLDESLRVSASYVLSFGAMTWPHMMARVMLLEQIYRAQQILAGHPYHRS